jgi:chorismate mutase
MGKQAIAQAAALVLAVSGIDLARAQSPVDRLQPLVETSARRLDIAEQVALSKWDSGAGVEDQARETQVIEAAVRNGITRELSASSVSDFFRAQIEANKVIQYSLLAGWQRAGRAPAHSPIDLARTIRPALDHLQDELIDELAETTSVRAGSTCRSDVATAVGKYLSAHKHEAGVLRRIALDRALAATCAR